MSSNIVTPAHYTNVGNNDIESNQPIELNKPIKSKTTFLDLCGCCGVVLGLIGVIGVIGLSITYIVYVIISLCKTSYHEQKEICSSSNVWIYLLLSIILNTLTSSASAKSKINSSSNSNSTKSKSIFPVLLSSLSALSFTIWGCVELFAVDCIDKLHSTMLYTMLEVSVIVNLVILGIIVLVGLVLCCANCWYICSQRNLN